MKTTLCYISVIMLFLTSCSKNEIDPQSQKPAVSSPAEISTPATILVDPVNCPPTLYQFNANAFQFNYARMKLVKGMSGQLTNITPSIIANYTVHVYMRSSTGKYYHLPATSIANIAYNYSLTSAFPQSSFSIKRGTGPEEIFESVIILSAKTAYLSSLNPQLNFADYGTVKTKLGF